MAALETLTFTGLTFHEWLAVLTIMLVMIHLLFSWAWIAVSSRRLASGNATRTRVNYFLNFCLFTSVIVVMLSGLMISEVVLPALGFKPPAADAPWRFIHNKVSDFVLILAGLHLAINWDWSVAMARKYLKVGRR